MNAINNRRAAENLPREPGQSSLSYENRPTGGSFSDLSPSSPQPLSRLKTRYTEESPTKSSPGESSRTSTNRMPNLIAAAQQQHNAKEEQLIGRLALQFRNVTRPQIAQAVRRHRGDPDHAINEIQYINGNRSSPPSSSSSPIPVPPPVISRPVPSPKLPPRPKKNEKSAIYANRGERQAERSG